VKLGFSRQSNRKANEGSKPPDRCWACAAMTFELMYSNWAFLNWNAWKPASLLPVKRSQAERPNRC
jgi:hypothetical protein